MICVTKLVLPLQAVQALRISDTYSLHRVVYSLFEDVRAGTDHGKPSGILFADRGMSRRGHSLVILSDRMPRRPEHGTAETTELGDDFFSASLYRFETTVNPVKRDAKTGRLVPVKGVDAAGAWFAERAPRNGFSVAVPGFSVDGITVDSFVKGGCTVTLQKARISGLLTVKDPVLFRAAVCGGIGRGRAFGCGLLMVSPLSK